MSGSTMSQAGGQGGQPEHEAGGQITCPLFAGGHVRPRLRQQLGSIRRAHQHAGNAVPRLPDSKRVQFTFREGIRGMASNP